MTFPIVIQGTGAIVGEIKLLGFADETQRTLPDPEITASSVTLDRREIDYFTFVMRQLRETIGLTYLRRSKHMSIKLTDGGYLSFADIRSERVAIPAQLLTESALPLSERARRLVVEDVMINAVYTLLGDRYCRGLQRYIDRFANPLWPMWHSRQQMVTMLAGLHRYSRLELEEQILLRDAYEQIELGDGDRQPYSEMLRQLQGERIATLPRDVIGKVIGLVAMTPALFPDFTDAGLLGEVKKHFVQEDGSIAAAEDEIYNWMLDNNRSVRDVSEVLWKDHIQIALRMEQSMRGINRKHNRATDILRRITGDAPVTALLPLFLAGEQATSLDQFCKPAEEMCRELQANLSFGIDNIRLYMQLVFDWIAEKQNIGRYPGDRVEFFHGFAERLHRMECSAAESAVVAYADAIDEHLRYLARQRAAEERAEAFAREKSQRARERLREKLDQTTPNLPEISTLLGDLLVRESDFLPDDVRIAVNDLLRRYYDHPEISQQLMAQLERQTKNPQSSPGFREAMAKRYSLSHDRKLSYQGMDSTQLLEIYVALLIFEDQIPDLEDAEGKLDIRREVMNALQRERGFLKGRLFDKKRGWLEDFGAGEIAVALAEQVKALRYKADAGKESAAGELCDTHFRMAALAAVQGKVEEALTHFREVVRLSISPALLELLDGGHLAKKLEPDRFKRANKVLRGLDEPIRRARIAGNYLELHARRAQKALDSGKRPDVELELIDKVLDTLETERVLGDRPPMYKILRWLPRVVTIGKNDYRIRDMLPAGAGGQAGQMALLKHVFGDEPFAAFMGYKIVETLADDGKSVGRFLTKVGINEYVKGEYLKVFPRLFPNFDAEMIRQRNGLPCQIFAKRFLDELIAWMPRKERELATCLRPFEARVVEIVEKHRRFPLLMLEFIPGLNDHLPKTLFAQQADANGLLARKPRAVIDMEIATSQVRDDIAVRMMRESGLPRERLSIDKQLDVLARLKAHSAALAVLLMNVDHQIFTVEGRLVPMDYEILLAPCFDPDFEKRGADPYEPVSTYFTKRINCSWVSDRDPLDEYLHVAGLYREFVHASADKIMDWALEAGFLLTEAGAVKDLIVRNGNRLPEDIQTLVRCGGTVFLSPNRRENERSVEYGAVLPRNELRSRGAAGLMGLLSGQPIKAVDARKARGKLADMTANLSAMQAALAQRSPSGDGADEATMAIPAAEEATMAVGKGSSAEEATLGITFAPRVKDEEATIDLKAQPREEEATIDLKTRPDGDEATIDLKNPQRQEQPTINLKPRRPG